MRKMKNLFSFFKISPIGVSWFVPVENMKSGPKKENMPKLHGPGVSWFAPITNTKPWREPLREQNWQGRHMDSHSSPAGPGKEPLKPFVRATLQVRWDWINFSCMFKEEERVNLWLRMLKYSHVTLVSGTSTVHLFSHSLIKDCLTISIINHISPSVSEKGKAIEGKCCVATHWVLQIDSCTGSVVEAWCLHQSYVCSSIYITPIST